MTCPQCAAKIADNSTFCSTCGATVGGSVVPAAMPLRAADVAIRTSGMAIAGFVLAFFCGLLGLILSCIGLSECRKSNGTVKGAGFAIAGIAISCVSFLGVLAAVAIPAFVDYMHHSKSSEVTVQLKRMMRSAKTYYIVNGAWPQQNAPLTPWIGCCEQPGHRCAVSSKDFETDAWRQLDFDVYGKSYYQYGYTVDGDKFEGFAVGDLDCDNVLVTYRFAIDVVNGDPVASPIELPTTTD